MTMLIFCSNCGSYAPQSCIFSQVLNTGATLGKFFPFTTGSELPKGSLAPPSPDRDNWPLFPREHILALLPQSPKFKPQPSSLRPQNLQYLQISSSLILLLSPNPASSCSKSSPSSGNPVVSLTLAHGFPSYLDLHCALSSTPGLGRKNMAKPDDSVVGTPLCPGNLHSRQFPGEMR